MTSVGQEVVSSVCPPRLLCCNALWKKKNMLAIFWYRHLWIKPLERLCQRYNPPPTSRCCRRLSHREESDSWGLPSPVITNISWLCHWRTNRSLIYFPEPFIPVGHEPWWCRARWSAVQSEFIAHQFHNRLVCTHCCFHYDCVFVNEWHKHTYTHTSEWLWLPGYRFTANQFFMSHSRNFGLFAQLQVN